MSDDAPPVGARRRPWRRLAALFIAVAIVSVVAVAVVWFARPETVRATALFDVRPEAASLMGHQLQPPATDRSYDIFRKTQIALIKQKYVLTSALRDPAIASLSIFAGESDKEGWLHDHLEVQYPENGEILAITLRGPASQTSDIKRVVDAVSQAYKKEVLAAERQRTQGERDLLNQSLQDLNKDIRRKYADYIDIARNMGKPEGATGDVRAQIILKRLERVDDELTQLERELWKMSSGSDAKDSKLFDATKQRLAELTRRREAVQRELEKHLETSVELETQRDELRQMQQVANDMTVQLEKMDIDLSAPDRIRQIGGEAIIESPQFAAQ